MALKEVLRTGTFVDANGKKVTITDDTIKELINNFDSAKSVNSEGYKVPLFLGHPSDESTAPAHGWIKSLTNRGGILVAEFDKLTENAEKAIKNFSFRDVSVSVYKNILQHIGLTNTPAVPGLADFQYTAPHSDAEILTEQLKGDDMPNDNEVKLIGEKKDLEIKLTDSESKVEELSMQLSEEKVKSETLEAEKADLEKNKADAETKVVELEQKIEDDAKAAELSRDTSFVEKLVGDGKITPANKESVIARLSKYPKDEIEEGKTAKDLYMDSLSCLSIQMEDGEQLIDGVKKDAETKLSKLSEAKSKELNISLLDATLIVLNENPELNNEGANNG